MFLGFEFARQRSCIVEFRRRQRPPVLTGFKFVSFAGDACQLRIKPGARPALLFSGHHFLSSFFPTANPPDAIEDESCDRAASCKACQKFHGRLLSLGAPPAGTASTAQKIVAVPFHAIESSHNSRNDDKGVGRFRFVEIGPWFRLCWFIHYSLRKY